MATWLVTGGCGFIGSHLAEVLIARGDRVRILDDLSSGKRENVPAAAELTIGDVADLSSVRRLMQGVDGCFHLAAVASVQRGNEDWLGTHSANLTGTIAVFEAARQSQAAAAPVIYASSAAVYGDNPAVPLAETEPLRPLSAYGADKAGCELHGQVAWHVHRVPNIGFRFFNIYGPRQDPKSPYSGVIAIFADRIAAREPIDVHGDGLQVRDFVYVADVVRFLLAGMERAKEGARLYNVCTGRSTSVLDLARIIAEIAARKAEVRHGPARSGDIRLSVGDPSAATAYFGFRADTPIDQGLRQLLAAETPSVRA